MAHGFDVLVVGGGSAGCVVAARLAADPNRSVLLLEAGPDRTSAISPALRDGWNLPRGADWPDDWGLAAEPDARGDTQPLRRGKLLGGTSWLTRFAVRGSPREFDGWASAKLAGWSFDEILPAFRRLETDADFGGDPWHGTAGPLPIDRYLDLEPSTIHAAVVASMTASGIPTVEDLNRPGAVGLGRMPMSSVGGRRVSAADAYLPAEARPSNLTIRSGAHVATVLLEGTRATSVRLLEGSVVTADLIVLCAGTYGSPPILLRSGIGPAADLRALGIRVVVDLPGVGANLADHPAVELDLEFAGSASTGPVLHSLASWHSSMAGRDEAPDLAYWIGDPVGTPAAFSIESVLMQPRSRGSVRLRSDDPNDAPRIELPGVRDQADADRLGEAYLRAIELAGHQEIRALSAGLLPEAPSSLVALRRWVTENAYSIPHVVGTCGMGTSPDAGAVVDARGRVHGVHGLAVVDASIMPGPTSGFPNLVTMMVAEHLSERLAAPSARV